jgi:hypothetical protein
LTVKGPGVRIPLSPPEKKTRPVICAGFLLTDCLKIASRR